jgi:hypothetical protein
MLKQRTTSRRFSIATAPVKVMDKAAAQAALFLKGPVQAQRQWLIILVLVFSDILLALLAYGSAVVLQSSWGRGVLTETAIAWVAPNIAVWIGLRALLGLYPGYGLHSAEELRRQVHATLATLAITAIFALAFQVGDSLSRLLLGLSFLILLLVAPLVRYYVKYVVRELGIWGKPVAILGADGTAAQMTRVLQKEWGLGFKPAAVFDFHLAPEGQLLEGEPYGGTVLDALDVARKQGIDTAIFSMPNVRAQYVAAFVNKASASFPYVLIVPDVGAVTTSAVIARDFAGTLAVQIKHNLLNPWARRAKYALDLFAAVVGGLLLSPLLLAIAALIKLDSPGPVIYKQKRPGAGGKYFDCWKFRTMYVDAESSLTRLLESDSNLQDRKSVV